ncbi:Txe/YoeB family addiction module toxin [Ruminococcus sp. AF42-10]|nr:Txe/YoeB family addiction module toxin [Ruminococcus sp. AF42-10]RGF41894.1 Txe/YoeB family addiction module toxin [Ruminococcus sp. AF42-10]
MSNISFADDAWLEYLYWQKQDKKTLKKINALLKEIQRSPFDGAGKPEPLKNDKSGLWSRRINDKDRLVYSVNKDFIIVYQCKGHYDD